jgi:hypothetical protein
MEAALDGWGWFIACGGRLPILHLAWMDGSYITRYIGKAGVFFRRMEPVVQASIAEYFVLYICYLLRMCETEYTNNFYIQSETVIAH